MSDDDLRRAFDALREHDRANAPSFAQMKAKAEVRARARRGQRAAFFAASFAAAAIVVLAIWIGWPGTEPEPAIGRPIERTAEPLGFLLTPPSASVASADYPLDQIGEAW